MSSISFQSPIGILRVYEKDGAIIRIEEGDSLCPSMNPLLLQAEAEITEYMEGRRKSFSLPFSFQSGTELQKRVWKELAAVPYGQRISYSELAGRAGSTAVRAAASAVARNPIPIIIPCHRVVRKSGGIGEFSLFGKEAKEHLLALEARSAE